VSMHSGSRLFMLLNLAVSVILAIHAFPAVAQVQTGSVQMWLTTADRSALLFLQPNALHFSASTDVQPAIEINDIAQYQHMEGFGLAVTGGSAQLLMKMEPTQRTAPRFGTQG
jgi:glucosylceramidase